MSFPVAPFLFLPSAIKREVDVPVFHAQRVTDLATAARAVSRSVSDAKYTRTLPAPRASLANGAKSSTTAATASRNGSGLCSSAGPRPSSTRHRAPLDPDASHAPEERPAFRGVVAVAGGARRPMGGHKGYTVNVVVALLAGAPSGGGCTNPGRTALVNTMTSIAVDPAPFTDRAAYFAEIERYLTWVTGSPPKAPAGRVVLPGDIEAETRVERLRDGIPIDDTTWGKMVDSGLSASVTHDEIERLATDS